MLKITNKYYGYIVALATLVLGIVLGHDTFTSIVSGIAVAALFYASKCKKASRLKDREILKYQHDVAWLNSTIYNHEKTKEVLLADNAKYRSIIKGLEDQMTATVKTQEAKPVVKKITRKTTTAKTEEVKK